MKLFTLASLSCLVIKVLLNSVSADGGKGGEKYKKVACPTTAKQCPASFTPMRKRMIGGQCSKVKGSASASQEDETSTECNDDSSSSQGNTETFSDCNQGTSSEKDERDSDQSQDKGQCDSESDSNQDQDSNQDCSGDDSDSCQYPVVFDQPIELNSETFLDLIGQTEFVLVNFYSSECKYSRAFQPIFRWSTREFLLQQAQEEVIEGLPSVVFAQINYANNPSMAQIFRIDQTPTLALFEPESTMGLVFEGDMARPHEIINWIQRIIRALWFSSTSTDDSNDQLEFSPLHYTIVNYHPRKQSLRAILDRVDTKWQSWQNKSRQVMQEGWRVLAPLGAIELNMTGLEQLIKQGFGFVKFYYPDCPACQRFAPIWAQLANNKEVPTGITVASFNGRQTNGQFLGRYGIKWLPSVIWFGPNNQWETYTGNKSVEAMLSYLKIKSGLVRHRKQDHDANCPVDS